MTDNKREPSPEELVGQFFKRVTQDDRPYGHVTLQYISGITDALPRILQKRAQTSSHTSAPENKTKITADGTKWSNFRSG